MGEILQNAKAKTEIGPPSTDRALYFDKARSFNQSERALYRNFIVKDNKNKFRQKALESAAVQKERGYAGE